MKKKQKKILVGLAIGGFLWWMYKQGQAPPVRQPSGATRYTTPASKTNPTRQAAKVGGLHAAL